MMGVIITIAMVFSFVVLLAIIITAILHAFGKLFERIPDEYDEFDEYEDRN